MPPRWGCDKFFANTYKHSAPAGAEPTNPVSIEKLKISNRKLPTAHCPLFSNVSDNVDLDQGIARDAACRSDRRAHWRLVAEAAAKYLVHSLIILQVI